MRNDFFSTVGEILKYGGSTFAALIAASLYTATDSFFVGNWVGTDGLGAMALVFPVTMILTGLGTLVEIGGSAVVSEKIGAGKKILAEKIMRANYVYAFIIGIVFAIVGNIVVEPLLYALADNHDEYAIIDMAVGFLRITLCGVPFLLTGYLTETFMRCIEQPTHVFYLVGLTSLTNIILDALFVITFGWGIAGAAVATVIAQILGAVISLWYFRYSRQKFVSSWGVAGMEYLFLEFKIGVGFAIADFMMFFIEYFLNGVLLAHDASHLLAAAALSNIILSFVYLPLNGLDTGIQPLVSKLFAANKEHQCLSVMRYGFVLTMILTFAMYAALMFFTQDVARTFIADNEPVTPEMITFMRCTFLLQPFVGVYTWLSGIMAAFEDEWRNLLVSFLPLVVQVPLIWFLPHVMPMEYIALNFSALDVAEAALAFVLIRPFLRSKKLSLKKIFT